MCILESNLNSSLLSESLDLLLRNLTTLIPGIALLISQAGRSVDILARLCLLHQFTLSFFKKILFFFPPLFFYISLVVSVVKYSFLLVASNADLKLGLLKSKKH